MAVAAWRAEFHQRYGKVTAVYLSFKKTAHNLPHGHSPLKRLQRH